MIKKTSIKIVVGFILLLLSIGIGIFFYMRRQSQLTQQTYQPGQIVKVAPQGESTTLKSVEYAISRPLISNLEVPWSLVFTSPDRVLIAERPGRIRQATNWQLTDAPLHTFSQVDSKGEEGLMGLTIDPDYESNQFIYACLAYPIENGYYVRVDQLIDKKTSIEFKKTLIDKIPAAKFHAGCRIKFGPDNLLYITTGDGLNKDQAQDLSSLAGKILRINSDGSIPDDNPFTNSPVYSLGHRNPQGIDWLDSGQLVSTEHGPSVIDGPPGGDEVNLIFDGQNYGWPIVSHERSGAGMVDPALVFTPAVAPASAMVYSGDVFNQYENQLFFGGLIGRGLYRVKFDLEGKVTEYEKMAGIDVGRIRDVIEGPDGLIYFTTSNTDGRGQPGLQDDAVYRLEVKN